MSFFGPPVYVLAAALFALGVLGFTIRRNAIVVLLSVELMLNAANLTFLASARGGVNANEASSYAIFVILVAAAEAASGTGARLRVLPPEEDDRARRRERAPRIAGIP